MKIKLFYQIILIIYSFKAFQIKGQVIESVNPVNSNFNSISYKIHDSSFILNLKDKQILVHRGIYKELQFKRAIYSPSGNFILGFNNLGDSSELTLMRPDQSLISSLKLDAKINTICYGDNDSIIYILDSNDEYANLLCLNQNFQTNSKIKLDVLSSNSSNMVFQPKLDMIFIGGGLNYHYIKSDFKIKGKFNTPHFSYVQADRNLISILNLYSDGSYLEWMNSIDSSYKFSIEDVKAFEYNGFKTDIEIFKTWSFSPDRKHLLTVGYTGEVTLNDISTKKIKPIKLKGNISFIFFIDNKTYAYYDEKKAKIIYKKL